VTGNAYGGNGSYSAFGRGGHGGDAILSQAVDGSSNRNLTLQQRAFGGDGESGLIAAGAGGIATSDLSRTSTGATKLEVRTEADGGSGGWKSDGGSAGVGGYASANSETINSFGSALAYATALGGSGGQGQMDANGGWGASANASARATASGLSDAATARGSATGGSGGGPGDSISFSYNGGRGGDAISQSTANGNWRVTAEDFAKGGDGGGDSFGFVFGGRGGDAWSTADGTGTDSLTVKATALGGRGGFGGDSKQSGAGGNATAIATGTGMGTSSVSVTANATGGGDHQRSQHGTALARATAVGTSGTVSAKAVSNDRVTFNWQGGVVQQISATARGPVASTVTAEARTAVSQPAPDPASAVGLQSASFVTAMPEAVDVRAALSGNTAVAGDFDMGGTSDLLGLVTLGGAYPGDGSGLSQMYISNAYFQLDMTSLLGSSQDLIVGLLDPTVIGSGFDTLTFQILKQNAFLLNETFTLLDDALNYFNDQSLNFGDWTTGLGSGDTMQLEFIMYLTSDDPGAGFYSDLIFGNFTPGSGVVPEPSAIWLFGSGLLGLIGVAKHKRRF